MITHRFRAENKTPGGKLVGVELLVDDCGLPVSCSIDGDFFIDGGDDRDFQSLIDDLEEGLVAGSNAEEIVRRHLPVRLVGTDVRSIQTAFQRALDRARRQTKVKVGGEAEEQNQNFPMKASHLVPPPFKGSRSRTIEGIEADSYRRRWRELHPQLLGDKARQPQEQMDLDQRWARQVAGGRRPATLRFWKLASSAVVIGRFQSTEVQVDLQQARHHSISVVRRCTGGGAMLVQPQDAIVYSLYAPLDFVRGISIEESYRLCNQWLVDSLEDLGIHAHFSGLNDIASPVGKIGGAAQRRFPPVDGGPGSVLHHVTLAYDIDIGLMARVLRTSQEKMSDKSVASASKRVDTIRTQTQLSCESVVDFLYMWAGK